MKFTFGVVHVDEAPDCEEDIGEETILTPGRIIFGEQVTRGKLVGCV